MKSSKIKFIGNVLDPINKGWVRLNVGGQGEVCLPYTTKVELIEMTDSYEKVKILDGYYKNSVAELPFMVKDNKSHYSFLIDKCSFSQLGVIKIIGNVLKLNNLKSEVIAEKSVLNKKNYFIKFPIKTNKKLPSTYFDEHKGGSRFAETWFPLLAKGEIYPEKYLHFGSISQGCITVKFSPYQNSLWNILYTKLLRSRIDSNNLGRLIIEE
jgi:hypothetical protein